LTIVVIRLQTNQLMYSIVVQRAYSQNRIKAPEFIQGFFCLRRWMVKGQLSMVKAT